MTDKILPGGKLIKPLTTPPTKPQTETPEKTRKSFQEVLEQKVQKHRIQFSKHAAERLARRAIDIDTGELDRLDEAVQKAAAKGARESLVVMGDNAYVVSIKNNLVITALDGDSMRENVFTNIDSAIIMD